MKKREPVPVIFAIALYRALGTWARVARCIRRRDGSAFTAPGIQAAVRRYDRGAAA